MRTSTKKLMFLFIWTFGYILYKIYIIMYIFCKYLYQFYFLKICTKKKEMYIYLFTNFYYNHMNVYMRKNVILNGSFIRL